MATAGDITVLKYRMSLPLRIILSFLFIVFIVLPLVAGAMGGLLSDLMIVVALGCLFGAFFWFNNAGYRVGYDDDRLWMRDFGFWNRRLRWPAFHGIAFDDIALIEPRTQTGAPSGSRYVPGEYLAIESIRPEDEEVWIYPDALHEAEMIPLLVHLAERRPDLMPQVILDRLAADGLVEHA